MCKAVKLSLYISGDILEIGAQWAIAKKDIEAFERYMAQLKTYYLDYRYGHCYTITDFMLCLFLFILIGILHYSCFIFFREDLPESAYKFQLLGLNLLRLLAQNKLSDFHTVSFFH